MSDFFDKAKEVTKDVCNSAKLHAQILSHEAKIRELYYKLGRDYYNAIENNIDDVSSLENICEEIKTRFEKISALKKTLETGDNFRLCEICGSVNDDKNAFCGRCGNKLG